MAVRVLITGGMGFLGRRLAASLSEEGSQFRQRPELQGAELFLGDLLAEGDSATSVSGATVTKLDVTNVEDVRRVFAEIRPDVVIHAAANKYIDRSEKDPFGSIDVNLLGSENIGRVALESGVGVVIGLSSSAATPPQVSVYSLGKAIMERMFCSLDGKTKTKFVTVRLGNIAWSTGSVLPAWQKMLDESGVLGTNGPENMRFFCTADQAVETVWTALAHIDALAGKVLIRKLKAARMRSVLERFVALKGGKVETLEAPLTGRSDEGLIGDLEVPYTFETTLDGVGYYVISFNQKAATPVPGELFASKAELLSDREIGELIASQPS